MSIASKIASQIEAEIVRPFFSLLWLGVVLTTAVTAVYVGVMTVVLAVALCL